MDSRIMIKVMGSYSHDSAVNDSVKTAIENPEFCIGS
jgi:hypothetical protein